MDLVALYILEPTAVESSTLVHSNDLKMLIVKKKKMKELPAYKGMNQLHTPKGMMVQLCVLYNLKVVMCVMKNAVRPFFG